MIEKNCVRSNLMMKKIFLLLLLCFSNVSWAGDFEDGMSALKKGNLTLAASKFKSASAKGDAYAQYNLAIMYMRGEGVLQDNVEALRLYKLAAMQGHISAQVNLGYMYLNGEFGVVQDYAEAMRWLRMAASNGDGDAQLKLGVMYGEGWGVQQDFIRAHMWSNLAAVKGASGASQNRDISAKMMTSDQITFAQRIAKECLARNYKNCD